MLHKNITDEKASFVTVVLNLASGHIKDIEYVDCVQQYFRQENNKEPTVQCVLEWNLINPKASEKKETFLLHAT